MKRAVCIGINNYPGSANDLQGCVNDANDWTELLVEFGFEVETLLDSEATRSNIKEKLQYLVDNTDAGDIAVFTYSGHGTQVLDKSGDEADGYDEALYVYDGVLIDDDLRAILSGIHPNAQLIVISDSCFSGTVTRVRGLEKGTKKRFVKPRGYDESLPVKSRLLENTMLELLISGCSDTEYSYDAYINGRYNGAMTRYAIDSINQNREALYKEFYSTLRNYLPSKNYPQTPQLEGSDFNKNLKLFTEVAVEEPIPDPNTGDGCLLYILKYLVDILS